MVNCTGAGDSFVAGMVYGLLTGGSGRGGAFAGVDTGGSMRASIQLGAAAARLSVESPVPIHPALCVEELLGIVGKRSGAV
jgi:sugar/nucleoside kinase (ribokinase family)